MTHATTFTVLPALSDAFNAPGSAAALKVVIDADNEACALSAFTFDCTRDPSQAGSAIVRNSSAARWARSPPSTGAIA